MQIIHRGQRDHATKELDKPVRGSWINIVSHDIHEVEDFARELKLDEGLMTDGIDLYEAPRIEREDGATYIYTRYCEPSGSLTSTEPLLIVVTSSYLVTLSRKHVQEVDKLFGDEATITTQRAKLILMILSEINKGYRSYINSITKKIFSTRARLSEKTIINNDEILFFIDLEEDLNEFLAALQPYGIVLDALARGRYFKLHEDDRELVEDLQLSTNELIDLSKSRLKTMQNIRGAYTTIATNNLNKIFKRLTSITIFLMVPTLISGLYGMNVELPHMGSKHAFTVILAISMGLVVITMLIFRKKRWL
ncbi:MAG: magnesium transporter CorA family protein [Patescibacteria group bacterium]